MLVVGVGGQGVLLLARCVGEAALAADQPVMVGALHGMSQRGGSVSATVCLGDSRSSFIPRGGADVVLGLEPLEVWRALPAMSQRTTVVMNPGRVVPFTLVQQGLEYPELEGIRAAVTAAAGRLVEVDGSAVIHTVGDARFLNMLMLGALAELHLLPQGPEALWQAVEARSPGRFLSINQRAFTTGRELVQQKEE
jgi:indolepyruvate ferredoxin oxidoreductase beta subunit